MGGGGGEVEGRGEGGDVHRKCFRRIHTAKCAVLEEYILGEEWRQTCTHKISVLNETVL